MNTWRNRFNHVWRAVWHYLHQPLFQASRWPETLTEGERKACFQWLESCWQLDLPEHTEAVQLLERCWQQHTLGKQG